MTDMTNPIIECHHIYKSYQDGDREVSVLRDLSFSLESGRSVAIMGGSGCGKSTLLNILGGLDRPSSGEVLIRGKNLSDMKDTELALVRNREMGFVYQLHHLLMEFSALENVAMPLLIGGARKPDAMNAAADLLDKVGLAERLTHRPSQLSGGERQRVAIARALVTHPACVLMDEPTGNLDEKTASSVFSLIMQLKESLQTSFVIVTHDMELAKRIGSVLSIHDGRLLDHAE
jgi:lipoprotein-releasing system ATP-binding protein